MGVIRINELPAASGLTSDDLLVIMDDPSGSAITKKIPIDIFKSNEIDWTLIINSDNSVSAYNITSITSSQFASTDIIGLRIGNNVTAIGDAAFQNCSDLTGNLIIPNSVTTIGDNAFNGCNGFAGNLTIGNGVITIGESAFQNCSSFTGSLTIPNSVTTIGDNAFLDCTGFNGNLTIGNSVTTISFQTFQNCGFTGNLIIPNSVTTIAAAAFAYSPSYNGTLTIGSGVSSIGTGAFYECSGFTDVDCYIAKTVFPNGIEFSGCTFTTLHARASDSTWTAGTTTLGGHTFNVIKDL
jgi:hypothetical protein